MMNEIQEKLLNNDSAGLKLLYEEFSNQLLQFAFTIIPLKQVAEEIVEDVFIKIWEKRQRVAKIENLKMYLYITTRNISYSYYRKYHKRKYVGLDELTLPCYQLNVTPEEIMISAQTLQSIQYAINNLSPQCRLIFKLVKEDGLKYKEVAQILQLSPKTVENQMGIALKKIHNALSAYRSDFVKKSK